MMSEQELLRFLRQRHTAVLATVDSDGQPRATAVYYLLADNLSLHFITKDCTGKFQNLHNNPRFGLTIVDESTKQAVQMEGMANEVTDPDEFAAAFDLYEAAAKRKPSVWSDLPISRVKDGYCIFCLQPSWVRWSDFRKWEDTIKFEKTYSSGNINRKNS